MTSFELAPTTRLQRLQVLPRPDGDDIALRALERELEHAPAGPDFLDITYADTGRFPAPSWAMEEFTRAATGGGMTYTPYRGDPGVRSVVAERLTDFLGIDVDGNTDVIITPGSQAGLYTGLASILEPGDRVVMPDLDYMTSERSARYFGADVEFIPLQWGEGTSPRLDLEALRAAIATEPKLFMFSHPNNPTGMVFDPEHVAEIADVLADSRTFVIADELYSRLVYDGRPFAHLVAERGMRDRTVTTLGPSKTESLSGFRIGVAVAPPQIVDRMEDVMGIAALRCPAYAQHLLTRWLADDQDYVAGRTVEYQALRDAGVEAVNQMPGLSVVASGGSSYLFPSFSGLDATDQEIALALKTRAGLVVNPGYQFGPGGRGHFRICFAQDESTWAAALERMGDVLSTMPRA